jgi:hypothetical protein
MDADRVIDQWVSERKTYEVQPRANSRSADRQRVGSLQFVWRLARGPCLQKASIWVTQMRLSSVGLSRCREKEAGWLDTAQHIQLLDAAIEQSSIRCSAATHRIYHCRHRDRDIIRFHWNWLHARPPTVRPGDFNRICRHLLGDAGTAVTRLSKP